MTKPVFRIMIFFLMLLCVQTAWGGQIKAYVATFAVSGAPNKDELKGILQSLMMSRLSGEAIVVVDSPAASDIQVSGSYVVFGKIFSIDAVAKNSAGQILTRSFVQGDNQDQLIPAMGKLAKALSEDVVKAYIPVTAQPSVATVVVPEQKSGADVIKKATPAVASSEIIRPLAVEKSSGASWVSQRIPGAMAVMAHGRLLASGERELFLAGNRTLRYYLQGKDLKLLTEIPFAVGDKILSLDTADLDGDGVPEIYLTILNGTYLVSQVWLPVGNNLQKVADKLAYFFRGSALEGKEKRIYAQEKGMDGDFYGDVYELVKSADKFTVKNPFKLPRFGTIYNFNKFVDAQGKSYYVLLNADGYLIVYSAERSELWRSSDKFGGSELHFQRPAGSGITAGTPYQQTAFLEQRIVVTKAGEIVVPQNSGFWVVGNSRSYSKNSVFGFAWNGSSLEEKWRTRQTQNYLADFAYDESAKELVLLEVVQKEGLVEKGASAVLLKKVE